MFKIAYCAGHYLGTDGKRLPAELDKNETREWVLNDRVADHFAKAAQEYEGVALYRTDDQTGKTFVDIPDRVKQANDWGADLYIDMHHNAAENIFSGGGVEAYSYPGSTAGGKYRDAIYQAVVAAGGLRGNRSQPLQEKKFDSLRLTKMTAVLIEYGYMNSTVDAPVILTDAYAKKVAYATMEAVANVAGLKKKVTAKTELSTYSLTLRQLREGDEGEDVRALQILLNGRGFSCGIADGIFGTKTGDALGRYQRSVGEVGDKVAGPITMRHLLGAQ